MGIAVARSVGISLRNGEAHYVYLSRFAGRVRLVEAGCVQLPEGAASPAAEGGREAGVAAPVERLPERLLRAKPDAVVLGLPRREAVLRTVSLPGLDDDKDLAGLLAYEIERHLPFPAEEACYHFQRLRKDGEQATVLLAATRRGDVERHLEAAGELGVQPTAVEVSALATLNALLYRHRPKDNELFCLIVIEGEQAEVSAVRGRDLRFSRVLAVPGDPYEPLARELGRSLEAADRPRTTVFVHGGGADLCLRLAGALGVTVQPWVPVEPPADAAAFGLALQGLTRLPLKLDLLPPDRRPKPRERALAVTVALLALLAALGVAWGAGAAHFERQRLSQLTERVGAVRAQAAAVTRLKTEHAKLRTQLQLFETLLRERTRGLETLKELVAILPGSVYVSEFSLEGTKLQIRGTTGGSASELIAAFERSPYFMNAAFISPISAQGTDKQGFQLQAEVKGR